MFTQHYKVQFVNPDTGVGFIEGYSTAKIAHNVANSYNDRFRADGNKGIKAKYLGFNGKRLEEKSAKD